VADIVVKLLFSLRRCEDLLLGEARVGVGEDDCVEYGDELELEDEDEDEGEDEDEEDNLMRGLVYINPWRCGRMRGRVIMSML
jgi:hypothetical protein